MEHGRPPHDEEVAAMVGMTVDKMKSIVKSARAPSSMERPIGDEDSATVGVRFQTITMPGVFLCVK